MKTLIAILLTLGITTGASAQKVIRGGGFRHVHPRVTIGIGAPLYPGFYYGPGFGPWYGYPYYNDFGYRRPSRLDAEIRDIQSVYQAKIHAARGDKSVPRSERKQQIRQLKVEREQAIADARKAWYAPRNRSSEHNDRN